MTYSRPLGGGYSAVMLAPIFFEVPSKSGSILQNAPLTSAPEIHYFAALSDRPTQLTTHHSLATLLNLRT